MKLRNFDNLRRMECTLPIILNYIGKNSDMQELLTISSYISLIRTIDICTMFYTEQLTSDYKELKEMYNKVVANTCNLIRELELNHPIEIFSSYVYLYRNGYLSYEKYFMYDSNLKDIARLGGIDVIRGKGVCRNIAAHLTDIYNSLGYNSSVAAVYVPPIDSLNTQKYCDTDLVDSEEAKQFVNAVMFLSKYIRLSNHMITKVIDGSNSYILDPTNDGLLHYNYDNKSLYFTDDNCHIKYGNVN